MPPDTGEHLPYADNCVALALSKTLGLPQAQVVRNFIDTYSCVNSWKDLEEDTNLKAIFTDANRWTPVKVGGGTWADIRKECQGYRGAKSRFFAIHWGKYTSEQWGKPDTTFHAICIQVKSGVVAVFGNNEEPQTKRDASKAGNDYRQTSPQHYARVVMKDSDWVSAWGPV
jgi:hypothetical protein